MYEQTRALPNLIDDLAMTLAYYVRALITNALLHFVVR